MTIKDVTDLLKSIVRESSSIMQRRLEMFHSQEAGEVDARIYKTQTSRFHHTILPTVAGSFFISRAVFKYMKLPPYFLAFHGQNNTFSRAVFRFLRLPP